MATANDVVPTRDGRDGLQRQIRDMPEPPRNYCRLVGPGIVAAGVPRRR
jgi:hypothetical protein